MIPGEDKAEVSLSSEFFKKLNQQIVQKDNLIKLLQLQIKSLKSQLEENTGDGKKKDDLSKVLENKESEIKNLESELTSQRSQLVRIQQEKDEQIKSLNQLIADQKNSQNSSASIAVDDPRVPELEATVARLEEELTTAQQQATEAAAQNTAIQQGATEAAQLQEKLAALEAEVQARDQELVRLQGEIASRDAAMAEAMNRAPAPSPEAQARLVELEQDVATLKGLLEEKDQQMAAFQNSSGTDAGNTAELEALKAEGDQLRKQVAQLGALASQAVQFKKAADEAQGLKAQLAQLETENAGFAEVSMKLTALEEERNHLMGDLELARKKAGDQSADLAPVMKENAELKDRLEAKEQECSQLRRSHNELMSKVEEPTGNRVEVEQLTNQVADQLLAIQRLQEILRENQNQLQQKDREINDLNMRLASSSVSDAPIKITSESSDIVASFIDFFDELDAMLGQNPNPQLQALHKKLLERLIIPNEIQYQPVIADEFDANRHIATDYFRSDSFPERCIVFEVEKGYRRGDHMVKKSKVWVVQNLFSCQACGIMQTGSESRFCHMCGEKIMAPNGLPVDSLPDFQPTPNTYLRFAEAKLEKKDFTQARLYLTEGLKIDPSFVPLLIKMADVHSQNSEFAEALDVLKKASLIRPDPKVLEQISALGVRKTIFEQARNLNLPPEEFEKLMGLLQQKN